MSKIISTLDYHTCYNAYVQSLGLYVVINIWFHTIMHKFLALIF